MSEYGIVTPQVDTTLDQKKYAFDSRNPRLQIALDHDPKHLDIITMGGGAPLHVTDSVAPNNYQEEILLPIKHGLGYRPKCFVYFFMTDKTNPANNAYAPGAYFYSGTSGVVNDILTFRVDETNFWIVHTLRENVGTLDYTSTAPNFTARVKYMICSNPVDQVTLESQR